MVAFIGNYIIRTKKLLGIRLTNVEGVIIFMTLVFKAAFLIIFRKLAISKNYLSFINKYTMINVNFFMHLCMETKICSYLHSQESYFSLLVDFSSLTSLHRSSRLQAKKFFLSIFLRTFLLSLTSQSTSQPIAILTISLGKGKFTLFYYV